MASSVFYKFRSQRDESRVSFDGTGISVFDLKKEIILANNLGKANDFDLYVYDRSSNEEYKDDSQIIPRSTAVIVKRLPSIRPGKGKAAMYIAGAGNAGIPTSETTSKQGGSVNAGSNWHKGAMSKRFDVSKEEPSITSKLPQDGAKPAVTKDDEQAAMEAMFQAQTANWEETQEKMSHAQRIYTNPRGTGFSGRGTGKPHVAGHAQHHQQPDRPLPPSYVCYRCGQKGHWIHDCPTNNDREFDNKPRIKRTTGIPRSFLKTVDNPTSGPGVMVTPEGGYVIAQPDSASWQKQVSRPKGLTAADVRERVPTDTSLVCPIDNKLFRDAVKTPCCGTSYCEECIQTHLLERDFLCPNCGKKIASLDKILMDKPTRTKVADYIDKAIEDSKKDGEDEPLANATSSDTNVVQKSSTPDLYANNDQDFYSDQQPGGSMDMSQIIVDSIPQLQAQVTQLSAMLQNPALPNQARQTAQMQYHEYQMQLQQAQTVAATLAMASGFQQQQQQQQLQQQQQQSQNMQGGGYGMQGGYQNNQFSNQQPAGQDSAYQRLPVNNRRHLKRDRPSDFLEVAGTGGEAKVARYWE